VAQYGQDEVVVGWDCGVGAVDDGEGYEGVEDERNGELFESGSVSRCSEV